MSQVKTKTLGGIGMLDVTVAKTIFQHIPQFKLGVIHYTNIVVSVSPQMLRGRFQLFQEHLKFEFEDKKPSDDPAIQEWRTIVKKCGSDPSRYRHSAEALLRRVVKGNFLTSVNSAVDVTNLLSLQYKMPFGIYDLNKLALPIQLNIGTEKDAYEALNGRTYHLTNKLMLQDKKGPFGSPFVDSKRSSVSIQTTNGLHIVYLLPSTELTQAKKQLKAIANMFSSLHGGEYHIQLIKNKEE